MVFINTPIPLISIVLLVIAAGGWTIVTRRNTYVKHLLLEGWTPLFIAMIISSGTGVVLDMFVGRYESFAMLAVVISGMFPVIYVVPQKLTFGMKDFLEAQVLYLSQGFRQPCTLPRTLFRFCPPPQMGLMPEQPLALVRDSS